MRKTTISSPIASLVPGQGKVCTGRGLARALVKTELSEKEVVSWHRELETARKTLKAPADKWR